MERIAEGLQVLGALGVMVGVVLVLAPGWAVLVLGGLAVLAGVVLEIGNRPRRTYVPHPLTPAEQRAHSLADMRAHASER